MSYPEIRVPYGRHRDLFEQGRLEIVDLMGFTTRLVWRLTCEICEQDFRVVTGGPGKSRGGPNVNTRYCSDECRKEGERRDNRAKQKRWRDRQRAA